MEGFNDIGTHLYFRQTDFLIPELLLKKTMPPGPHPKKASGLQTIVDSVEHEAIAYAIEIYIKCVKIDAIM